jgi:hypothetical protein
VARRRLDQRFESQAEKWRDIYESEDPCTIAPGGLVIELLAELADEVTFGPAALTLSIKRRYDRSGSRGRTGTSRTR